MPPKKAKAPKLTLTNAQFKELFDRIGEYALSNTLGDYTIDTEIEADISKQIQFMRELSRNKESKEYLREQLMMCTDGDYFGLNNWMDLWKKYKPTDTKKTEAPKKKKVVVSDDECDEGQIDNYFEKSPPESPKEDKPKKKKAPETPPESPKEDKPKKKKVKPPETPPESPKEEKPKKKKKKVLD